MSDPQRSISPATHVATRLDGESDYPAPREPGTARVTMESMAGTAAPVAPQREVADEGFAQVDPDRPWITLVWNDPINLMSYVTHVFMTVFGYPKEKAEKLMLDVHHRGKAVVSSGPRERMELDVTTLHGYGLWATMEQSG